MKSKQVYLTKENLETLLQILNIKFGSIEDIEEKIVRDLNVEIINRRNRDTEMDNRTNIIDIVLTKADLNNYSEDENKKNQLTDNDIIVVLTDEAILAKELTENPKPEGYKKETGPVTFYRWNLKQNTFEYAGKLSSFYTEVESDYNYVNRFTNQDIAGIKTFIENATLNIAEGATLNSAGEIVSSGSIRNDGSSEFNGKVKATNEVLIDTTGKLLVESEAEFKGNVTTTDTSLVTIKNELEVTEDAQLTLKGTTVSTGSIKNEGATTLAGQTTLTNEVVITADGSLSSSGSVEFNNTVTANKEVEINSSLEITETAKLTIAGSTEISGNTTSSGSFSTTGESTFNGKVDLNETVDLSKELNIKENAIVNLEGNLEASGTIHTTGATTFDGEVSLNKETTFTDTVKVTSAGEIINEGPTTLSNKVDIEADTIITADGSLTVDGESTFKGETEFNNKTTLTGEVIVTETGNLLVESESTFEKNLTANEQVNITKKLEIKEDASLILTGDAQISGDIVSSGTFSTTGNTTFDGKTTFTDNVILEDTGSLTINGITEFNAEVTASDKVKIESDLEILENATLTLTGNMEATGNISSSGSVILNGEVTTNDKLTVSDTATVSLAGEVYATNLIKNTGKTELTGVVDLTDEVNVSSKLNILKNATLNLSGDLSSTGNIETSGVTTFNGGTTFNGEVNIDATPTKNQHATRKDYVDNLLSEERQARINGDAALQQALADHITEVDLRSDVVDVVGTKADLDNYNKENLTANDIIKVLEDTSVTPENIDPDNYKGHITTYYRFIDGNFVYVGKAGPYFTEAELVAQTLHLRDKDIEFNGTKTFAAIKSSQNPTNEEDLTPKKYVDGQLQSAINNLDSLVVHLAGDETISGTKTWTPTENAEQYTPSVIIKNPTTANITDAIAVTNGGTYSALGTQTVTTYQSGIYSIQQPTSFSVGLKKGESQGITYGTGNITLRRYIVDDNNEPVLSEDGNKQPINYKLSFPKETGTLLVKTADANSVNCGIDSFYTRALIANEVKLERIIIGEDEIEGSSINIISNDSNSYIKLGLQDSGHNTYIKLSAENLKHRLDDTTEYTYQYPLEDGTLATTEYVNKFGGKIDTISVNGELQQITEDKNVNIEIPTTKAVNQIIESKGYITETDAKKYTDTKVAGLVDSAPETLDTLKELSKALNNDENFANTVLNKVEGKISITSPIKQPTHIVDGEEVQLGVGWNDYDTFVYAYSPEGENNGKLWFPNGPQRIKISQGWNPDNANSTEGLTIVQRTASGTILAAEPQFDNEVATKKYVDNTIAENLEHSVGITNCALVPDYFGTEAWSTIRYTAVGDICILSFYCHLKNLTETEHDYTVATLPESVVAVQDAYSVIKLNGKATPNPEPCITVKVTGNQIHILTGSASTTVEDGWASGQLVFIKKQ